MMMAPTSTVTPARLLRELGEWRRDDLPAYRALAERLRLLVLDGRLPVGTRLPAERELCGRLELSRNTVAAAYGLLREREYLESVRGSGSRLRLPEGSRGRADLVSPALIDFRKASFEAHPGVMDYYRRALEILPGEITDSGYDTRGLPMLREAIADHYTGRGLATDPEQIIVTSGAQHALHLVTRALLRPGDRALIEHPSYPHAFDTLSGAGARIVSSPIDPHGWDIEAAEETMRRHTPALAYVMPDFHNPTGRSLSETDRARLAQATARRGTTLIADETTAWLDIDRGDRSPLAGHGPGIVTLGSLGKVAWGGLRIGWIRAPRTVVERVLAVRSGVDLGTAIMEQIVGTLALRDTEVMVGFRRAQLRRNRDHLLGLLAEHFPEWSPHVVNGGMSLWQHTGGVSTLALAVAARAEGLAIVPGTRFGTDGGFDHHLRLPFGYSPDTLTAGIRALRRAADAVETHVPAGRASSAMI